MWGYSINSTLHSSPRKSACDDAPRLILILCSKENPLVLEKMILFVTLLIKTLTRHTATGKKEASASIIYYNKTTVN